MPVGGRRACAVHALKVMAKGRRPAWWTGKSKSRPGAAGARTAGETVRAPAGRLERELAAWRSERGIVTIAPYLNFSSVSCGPDENLLKDSCKRRVLSP